MIRWAWLTSAGVWLVGSTDAAPTPLSGAQNGTLTLANSPYLATADLVVNAGQTLTIEPGVVVQFQNPDTALFVDGTLIARGTAGAPILFTSDDAQKASGQWEAIVFRGSNTNSILENCTVEYGAAAGFADEIIRCESASPTIRNCTIRGSRFHGIRLFSSDPRLENCQFTGNGAANKDAFALFMQVNSLPQLKNNTATGNGHDAIGLFDYHFARNGTWMKDNLPYTLLDDVYVDAGKTLSVEPGVVVQFQNPYSALYVDGTLVARAPATAPIVFTSDDAQKAPGQWEAIIFRASNTNSILENCTVEYGAAAGQSDESIRFETATATLRNCTISNSRLHGIKLLGSDPMIENCRFVNNGPANKDAFAIAMRVDSLPQIKNNTAIGNGQDAIGVFDYHFGRNGAWMKDNLPYTLLDDVYVDAGKTLTIEPEVIVQFQNPYSALIVDGTLIARATPTTPIVFTSDDAQKAPGQWEAIIFRASNTNSILENCIVEYGAAAGQSDENIRFENATATIRNCTIRNSRMHGLKLLGSDPLLDNCRFLNNGSTNQGAFAISMRVDSLPLLKNNTATGNVQDAIGVFDYHFGRNGTWLKDNLPYTLPDDVYVDAGKTLTLEPGVIVQFQNPYATFIVDGTLVARGTSTAPILFTSDKAQKAPGQWEALVFRASNTNSILENCLVECGAAAGYGDEMIRFEGATATLRNCTIRNSRMNGMTFLGSNPIVEDCQFLNNGSTNANAFAMAMRTDSWPRLANNSAQGNMHDAIAVFDYHVGRSGTWLKDNLPYTLLNDVYVDAGAVLTLEPGLIVQFRNADTALLVDGTLTARGSALKPIRFTSDEVQKAPGQWEAIIFRASNVNSILENCIVEYGAAAGLSDESIRFENATATIRNCTIRNSRLDGMRFQASDPVIENCQFVNNGTTNNGFAMAMRVDSLPKLKNNIALGNGRDAIAIFDYNFGRNGTWVKDTLPYTLVNDVYVNAGKTLTIEAGVTVQFQDPDDGLWVDGVLIARGTAAAPIRFTSDETAKKAGQWRALIFRAPDGNSNLENCSVEYGGANADGNIALFGSSPRINNCAVHDSASDAIHCNNSASLITASRIVRSARDGVRTLNGASPVINNNTIAGHAEFGVRNFDTARIINAKSNFWGDPSGPFDNTNTDGRNQLNANGKGDKVSEYVDWSAFLQTDAIASQPAQKVEVSPASLDFGSVIVGESRELFLVVRNTGGSDLTVTSAASDNSRFRVGSPAAPFTVAAGLQQAISVTFIADTKISATGTLTVKGNDAGQPSVNVSLKANGVVAGECLAAPSGLVGWWPGDGSFLNLAGTNHGQPLGGVSFSSGKVGQAFSFANDGERITIPHDSLLDVRAPGFTVEFWMKGIKNQPQGMYLVVDKSHGWVDSTGWMFQGYSDSGKLQFGIGSGGGGDLNFAVVLSTADLLDGIFHHAAGTWDGSTVRLYVDSVLQGEAALSAPANNTRPVNLGYSWGGGSPNRFFLGQVDELSIYRRALTTNEIQAVVAAGGAGKCKQANTAPVIALSPTSLNYSGVALGQTKDLTFTIRNSGNAAWLVNSIVSDNPRFTVLSPATPFNVANGAEQMVLVRFAPTDLSAQSGVLSINSNDPTQAKVTVTASGNSFAPPPGNCSAVPAGLVSWWPGEGNANDVVGSSSGTPSSTMTFPTGRVGRAMNFDGVGDQVKVAASSVLNVGAGDGLTIEAWINPADDNGKPIVEWNDGGSFGAHFWIYGGPGVLFANLVDTNRIYHLFQSPSGTVVANAFQHVVLTYDKRTGQASLFRNGSAVAQQNLGSFTPQTSTDLYFGRRASSNDRFKGLIDEISIYSRALAQAEIQALFNAGSAGKCAPSSGGGGDYVLSRIELTRTFGSPGLVPASTRPLLESLSADSRSFELGWTFKWPDPTGPNWNTAIATTALTQVPAALTPGAPATLAATMTGRWDTQGYGVERDHTINLSGVAGINQYSNIGSPSGVQSGQFGTTNTLTVPAPVAGEIALVLKAGLRFGDDHTGAMDIKLVYTRTSSQLASIRGKVTDAQTQAALAAVTIAVNGSTVAQSDANGNYAVTNVAAGLVAVSASKAGYLSQTKTVDLSTSQTAMVDFALVLAPTASVFFSDSFNRADVDRCALGQADLAFGGSGNHFYLPIFPIGGTDASRPIGASIVSGALQNNGLDFGGVQFAASDGACANLGVRGQNLGQDLNIRVDVLVPTDASGNVAQAGPYLRSRAAPAGDGIIGGADFDPSGGYWVQLHSHGEIKVKRLSPVATLAFSGRPLSFNPNVIHTLEIAAQGDSLQVALDGKLQTFNQDGKLTATVAIPTTGIGNQGAAGIAFGAEDNRGKIGGQRADNLIVSPFSSLTGLPVQDNFEQARPLVLSVRLDGQNNVLVSWSPDAGKVRIEMTASLSSPIQWTVLTNLPVLANGQQTITVPSTLRALPTLCFRGVSESAAQTPGGGTGKAASPLAGATESVSAALEGLNQIPITGAAQDFEARVNQQLGLLQNAVEAFDAALGNLVSQSDADIAALSKFLLLGRSSEDAATRQVSLAGAIGKANSGFVPGPLTDVINQFKQLKETVDDLKKLKKQIKDGSDLVNLITQNKSLEEIAASRSSFFKQISEVFKKMRADVEAPLNEMLLGKNQGRQDDVDDYTALVAFVRATDARLADLMSAPGFTIDSYRVLNLTDRQKDLVAQAFRSSTLRGRLYLRDNLLGFLKTLASAGVETYVSTIIEATGGKGVKSSAELTKKVYDFLTQNTAATPTTLRFISRKRFLRPDDLGSEVKADLFLLAKLPDGNTRLATFLVEGKNVINERGDLLLTLGLQLPVLAYDVLVVPREQENAPVKLLPFATTVNANVTSFVDLPLVHATKVTLNLGAKQRNSSGNLTDAVLTYDQAQSLTVRIDGFPQAADGPMGGVFDSETRPDGTQRGFFVIPFLPPDKPLKLNITGTPIEDFAEAFTVTSAQSERPVTLVLKAPPPVSVPVYVPTISWRLRNNADDTVVATGSGSDFTKTVTATVFNSRGPNSVSITISGTLVAPAVSLGQPFDLTCTLTRGVESAIAGLSSFSELNLGTAAGSQTVGSRVVPANPATISETLSFRPIATASGLYKIDLTGAPGFTGGGPLNTFIAADTFGGFSGNFSMSGDNSGIATGNGKVTITGNVYVGSELSTSNPHYRLDATVIYQRQ